MNKSALILIAILIIILLSFYLYRAPTKKTLSGANASEKVELQGIDWCFWDPGRCG